MLAGFLLPELQGVQAELVVRHTRLVLVVGLAVVVRRVMRELEALEAGVVAYPLLGPVAEAGVLVVAQ
jgi:hypothetical protein